MILLNKHLAILLQAIMVQEREQWQALGKEKLLCRHHLK